MGEFMLFRNGSEGSPAFFWAYGAIPSHSQGEYLNLVPSNLHLECIVWKMNPRNFLFGVNVEFSPTKHQRSYSILRNFDTWHDMFHILLLPYSNFTTYNNMYWKSIINIKETKRSKIECMNNGFRINEINETFHLDNLFTYSMTEFDCT